MSDRTTISLPDGMLDAIQNIAKLESRSVSSMVCVFIKEGLGSRIENSPSKSATPIIGKKIVRKIKRKKEGEVNHG